MKKVDLVLLQIPALSKRLFQVVNASATQINFFQLYQQNSNIPLKEMIRFNGLLLALDRKGSNDAIYDLSGRR